MTRTALRVTFARHADHSPPHERRVTKGATELAARKGWGNADRRGLHGRLVDVVGQMIVSGELPLDQPLAPDRIAEMFDVSRTLVRETIRVLESKGLVSARPRLGTRIRPQAEWDLLDPDVIAWRQQSRQRREQSRELWEMRAAIEPAVARLAAERRNRAALRPLASAWEAMEAAVRAHDLSAFLEADQRFHAALLTASGNHLFVQLGHTVSAALHAREPLITSIGQVERRALDLHRRVVEMVLAGDGDAAETAMREIVHQASPDLHPPL